MDEKRITLRDLAVGYGKTPVLQGLDADVRSGEFIGIIGRNGAGKSTLLTTVRGFLPRLGGDILYGGRVLSGYTEQELARQVAYLDQHMEVGFSYTGLEVVLAGRYPYLKWWEGESDRDRKIALDCMRYTGTDDLADRPLNQISGGQKQRILLAKVLAQRTPILFLDEPTTGLDMVYNEEIFRFARELSQLGKTVLMVVHELNMAARYCSRIWLLGEHRMLADGTPDEVLTEPLLGRAYEADVAIVRNPVNGSLEISTRPGQDGERRKKLLFRAVKKKKKISEKEGG